VWLTEREKARTKGNGKTKKPATVGGRYKGNKKYKGEKQISHALRGGGSR
jgi:hypothetical protein